MSSSLFSNEGLALHLQKTVLDPLKISAERFSTPPPSTTVRLLTGKCVSSQSSLWRVESATPLGLTECYAILPHTKVDPPISLTITPTSLLLFVDTACCEAVLRGSDVFRPGVLASTSDYRVGDLVLVVCVTRGRVPLKGSFVSAEDYSSDRLLVAGVGRMKMSRAEVTSGQKTKARGTAIENVWNRCQHPSQDYLNHSTEVFTSDTSVFLQNPSSMLPVHLLLARGGRRSIEKENEPPLHYLDACAAPGGKSSLLLSLLHNNNNNKQPPSVVLSCERSKSRAEAMRKLLSEHMALMLVNNNNNNNVTSRVIAGDVCHIAEKEPNLLFDGILLDPPCTGLGLRPRVAPHDHTLDDVVSSGEYQKQLIASCFERLMVGGRLTYSTCTISLEENEHVVAWVLETFKGRLVLARAETDAEKVLLAGHQRARECVLVPDDHDGLLREQLAPDALIFRFGPTQEAVDATRSENLQTLFDDAVGFFCAVFDRVS
eukprot:PhM_4_TR15227/c0_g1_i2/m.31017/K21971/NSUN6; methyltransferase NSUN6